MLRSDVNSDDMKGFAGSGLYQTEMIGGEKTQSTICYSEDPLYIDPEF
jgi:hypothetical protein